MQLRHYPVTVSAESKARPAVAGNHWTATSGKVCQAHSTRKSGDRPGSALGQNQRPIFFGFSIAVFRSRWEDRRERASANLGWSTHSRYSNLFRRFRCACFFVREGIRDVGRWAARFRGRRIVFTNHEVSGSAVQFRHYPVTVSARAGQGPPWRTTTGRQRLGRCPSLKKRESGDRLRATIRGDIK